MAGLPDDDIERGNGEIAGSRHLADEQEVVAWPASWDQGPARRRID
jgi:hypothetical protein